MTGCQARKAQNLELSGCRSHSSAAGDLEKVTMRPVIQPERLTQCEGFEQGWHRQFEKGVTARRIRRKQIREVTEMG